MSGRIAIKGTHNLRDVGGYPAAGGTTRSGQLYRSDALARVSRGGAAALEELGIGVVIDLRSKLERRHDPIDPVLPLACHVDIPIHGGSRSSITSADGTITLLNLYRQVVEDSAWSLVAAVSVIADSGTAPVLVHCTAGKDRTGLVVALALEAAGVERSAVVADYTQSALNLDGSWMNQTMSALVSQGVPISPRLFEVLGGSPDHAMTDFLDGLDRDYGSVAGFLVAHGLLTESLTRLKQKMVV